VLLNEFDKQACATLRHNRPDWNVLEQDVQTVDFSAYRGQIDLVTGGFPCQAFSYAGQGAGFNDIRGTMFFQFARAVQQIQPKVFMAENVRGLLNHDEGRTLATIQQVLTDLGYQLVPIRVLPAKYYRVPQKRERLFLIGIHADWVGTFEWPTPTATEMTLRDALYAGELYATDVPPSIGQQYPAAKKAVLDLVPAGGYWRDLPDDVQRAYMKKSYFLGGGKTGMARRLSWDEPSLTLTCSPSQNQTERCHPDQTRPLTVREYARIQTFPDDWTFMGSMSSQYKQIGNAVPVNLAYAVGQQLKILIQQLNHISTTHMA
jgi:DNA (cytosine-5)-methyltransferase 1